MTAPAAERQRRSPQAARNARYRARARQGIAVVELPIDTFATAAALISSGRLKPAQTLERRAVAAALADVVQEWAQRWQD